MKVRTSYSGGRFSMEQAAPNDEAAVDITNSDWEVYQVFLEEDRYWQKRLAAIDNEMFSREGKS